MGKYITVNIKPPTHARLIKYLKYGNTPDDFINTLLDHWDKTTNRDDKGHFIGGKK